MQSLFDSSFKNQVSNYLTTSTLTFPNDVSLSPASAKCTNLFHCIEPEIFGVYNSSCPFKKRKVSTDDCIFCFLHMKLFATKQN